MTAFTSHFDNVYGSLKELQCYNAWGELIFGENDLTQLFKTTLSASVGMCQVTMLRAKAVKAFSAVRDFQASTINIEELTQAVAALASNAIKVAVFAKKHFAFAFYAVSPFAQIIQINCDILDTSISISRNIVKLSGSLNENEKNKELAALARNIAILSMCALELTAKIYAEVSGAKYIILAASTVVTASSYGSAFYDSQLKKSKLE